MTNRPEYYCIYCSCFILANFVVGGKEMGDSVIPVIASFRVFSVLKFHSVDDAIILYSTEQSQGRTLPVLSCALFSEHAVGSVGTFSGVI